MNTQIDKKSFLHSVAKQGEINIGNKFNNRFGDGLHDHSLPLSETTFIDVLGENGYMTRNELLNRLCGPAEYLELLAIAEQDKARGGTSKQGAVPFITKYLKGNIFHFVIGHAGKNDYHTVRCKGFLTTLLREAEWVASGKFAQRLSVSFPKISELKILENLKPDLIELMDLKRLSKAKFLA